MKDDDEMPFTSGGQSIDISDLRIIIDPDMFWRKKQLEGAYELGGNKFRGAAYFDRCEDGNLPIDGRLKTCFMRKSGNVTDQFLMRRAAPL